MTDYREQMLDADLSEVLGGQTPPDLRERTLARLRERTAPALPDAELPRVGRPAWQLIAQAAGIAIVLGLIGWLVARPDNGKPTYVAGSMAKFVEAEGRLELAQGLVVLRTGAPELLILDGGGNSRVSSMKGLAIAGTHYRDGIELPHDGELTKLGLSEEERAMWPNAVKHSITTGALSLFLLSGSAMVDGVKVEAGGPRPEGLRPPLQWQQRLQPEPEPGEIADKPVDGVAGLKELLRSPLQAELRVMNEENRWGNWQIVECGDATMLAASISASLIGKSAAPAGWKHQNHLLFDLNDGSRVELAVYMHGNLCNVRLPGQQGWTQYDSTPELRKAVQFWFDKAAKCPPVGRDDNNGLRRLLLRAEDATFRSDADEAAPVTGKLTRRQVAQVVEVLWPGTIAASDSEGGTSRTVLQFSFAMPGGGGVPVEVCDNGWLAMKVEGAGDLVFRMLPAGSVATLHRYLAPLGAQAGASAVRSLRSWSGPRSRITVPRVELITDGEAWKRTWAEHDPAAEMPAVDFEREMVVAVFRGSGQNSRGFVLHEILTGDDGLTIVRVDEQHYQTFGEDRRVGVDRVTPFGIFVLTRSTRTVVVEENVQNIIGKPPLWKSRLTREPMLREMPVLDRVFAKYKFAQTWKGAATQPDSLFMTATDDAQWRDLWEKMIIADPQLPVVDWNKHMAVAMRGKILQGLGDFKLEYLGANADRTVLRLTTPTAQTAGGAPQYEARYAIWLIPRPAGNLVVETPRYTRIDLPANWLEEHVIKLK